MAYIEETRSWPLDSYYFEAFQHREGPSCPLAFCPHSPPTDSCLLRARPNSSSCTSGTSGSAVTAAGTDTDHHPAQPSPTEKAKSQGKRRRGGARGVLLLFGGGASCQPPVWARALEPWSLGLGGEQSTTEPSSRPMAPVQQQSAAQSASIQQASSKQPGNQRPPAPAAPMH